MNVVTSTYFVIISIEIGVNATTLVLGQSSAPKYLEISFLLIFELLLYLFAIRLPSVAYFYQLRVMRWD